MTYTVPLLSLPYKKTYLEFTACLLFLRFAVAFHLPRVAFGEPEGTPARNWRPSQVPGNRGSKRATQDEITVYLVTGPQLMGLSKVSYNRAKCRGSVMKLISITLVTARRPESAQFIVGHLAITRSAKVLNYAA